MEMDGFLWSLFCFTAPYYPARKNKSVKESGSNDKSTYCIFQVDGTFEFTQQLDGLDVPAGS